MVIFQCNNGTKDFNDLEYVSWFRLFSCPVCYILTRNQYWPIIVFILTSAIMNSSLAPPWTIINTQKPMELQHKDYCIQMNIVLAKFFMVLHSNQFICFLVKCFLAKFIIINLKAYLRRLTLRNVRNLTNSKSASRYMTRVVLYAISDIAWI